MSAILRYIASAIKFTQVYVLAYILSGSVFSTVSTIIYSAPIFVSIAGLEIYTQTQRRIALYNKNSSARDIAQQYVYTSVLSIISFIVLFIVFYYILIFDAAPAILIATVLTTEYITQEIVRIAVALNIRLKLSFVYLLRSGLWMVYCILVYAISQSLTLSTILSSWILTNILCITLITVFIKQKFTVSFTTFSASKIYADLGRASKYIVNTWTTRAVNNGDKLIASMYLDSTLTKSFLLATIFLQASAFLVEIAFSQIIFKPGMIALSEMRHPKQMLQISGAKYFLLGLLALQTVSTSMLWSFSYFSELIDFAPYFFLTSIGAFFACVHVPLHYFFYSKQADTLIRNSTLVSALTAAILILLLASLDLKLEFLISSILCVFYSCGIASKLVIYKWSNA